MNWKIMNSSIGECGNPYSPQKNYFIDSIISAAASHINSGVNALFNYWNTNNTNENNAQISKDTNEANYKLWQEQLAAQREQYEKERLENRFLVDQAYQREIANRNYQNEYNSPKHQMERYRLAGINPYLAMSGQQSIASAGVSSSIGSNPSMSPASPVPVQAYQFQPYPSDMLSGFLGGDSVQAFINNNLAEQRLASDISAQRVRSKNDTLETLAKINELNISSKYKEALTNEVVRSTEFEDYHFKGRSDSIALSNYMTRVNCKNVIHSMYTREIELGIQQALAASQINVNASQVALTAQNIANGMINGRILSADAAYKEFINGILTDPNNPENRARSAWNETKLKHLRFVSQMFGDLLNDIIPLKDLLKVGKF